MPALSRWFLILTALSVFGAGCGTVKKVTLQERAASFAPVEELKVGSDSIGNYVVQRTAFLINAESTGRLDQVNARGITFPARFPGAMVFGSAAAVDRRGYFVTAAHCIDRPQVGVVFMTGTTVAVKVARVVFVGDPKSSTSDFAILHVPTTLDNVFEWGTDFEPGGTVISSGVIRSGTSTRSGPPKLSFNVEPVGGHIKKVVTASADGVGFQIIQHDSPLAPGNSGGPLTDQRGRLIGVNIEGAAAHPVFHPAHRYANAVRPDLEWVRQVIERDAGKL